MTDEECIHLMPPGQCSICAQSRRGSGISRPAVHVWSVDDDTAACGLWFVGRTVNVAADDKAALAELINCSVASVSFKLGNIDSVLSGGRLESASEQCRSVARRLDRMSESD